VDSEPQSHGAPRTPRPLAEAFSTYTPSPARLREATHFSYHCVGAIAGELKSTYPTPSRETPADRQSLRRVPGNSRRSPSSARGRQCAAPRVMRLSERHLIGGAARPPGSAGAIRATPVLKALHRLAAVLLVGADRIPNASPSRACAQAGPLSPRPRSRVGLLHRWARRIFLANLTEPALEPRIHPWSRGSGSGQVALVTAPRLGKGRTQRLEPSFIHPARAETTALRKHVDRRQHLG